MSDAIQWAVNHNGIWYPLNLGLGVCPMIRFAPWPAISGWRVEIPGVALSYEESHHRELDDAKVAAVRIVVGMHAPRIRAEVARLAEVEAWLAEAGDE